jgi:hypothetical protein
MMQPANYTQLDDQGKNLSNVTRNDDYGVRILGSEPTATGALARERLWRRMTRESEAMAEHALNLGFTVPVEVLQRLDQALSADRMTGASQGAAESNAASGLALGADSMQTPAFVSFALAGNAV